MSLVNVFLQVKVFVAEFQVGLLIENSSVSFLFETTALNGGVVLSVEPDVKVIFANVLISISLPALIIAGLHKAGFNLNDSWEELPERVIAIRAAGLLPKPVHVNDVESACPCL